MPHIKNWAEVLPVPVIFLVTFAAIVLVGGQQRVADEELAEAIEAEEPFARKVAFRETLWLLPTILGGVAAFLLMQVPAIADLWHTAVTWSPTPHLYPLAGITFAVHGWIVGAAAGWVLRIFFTFVFGREAFGVGDIYILAAAGACAGWDIALLGLAFSVVLALAGWMLGLMLKHSMMIPFGPWLALGFLVALWMNRQAAEVVVHYVESIRITWESQPQMLAVAGGLMLVGCAAAIFLAKGVRRLVESDGE
jgi:prepilin signal peptidase PulO-like enzyme (type II secretory pathway)